MRRNTTKMHAFYTADAQEHDKNAYILYRGCAGTRQKCIDCASQKLFWRPRPTGQVSGKKTVRRNMGKYLQKKAILTVFGPFRTKCPKSAFFKDIDCAVQTPRTQENTCIL